MSYVICKPDTIRISLMVKKQYQPQLVGYVDRKGCTYRKEKDLRMNGEDWVVLKDLRGKNGHDVAELLGLFYSMDWENITKGTDDKFYILLSNSDRKGKAKKHAAKDRTEIPSGREGGASGEPAEADQPDGVGYCGDGTDSGISDADDSWVHEVPEIPGDGGCE